MATSLLILVAFLFFEVYYFVRSLAVVVMSIVISKFAGKKPVLGESIFHDICLTVDMDWQMHMNNSRYVRECDFARYKLWIESHIFKAVTSLGSSMTLAATAIRYRRSLQFLDRYMIRTKVLCWDDTSFYLENRFERHRDSFICAIVLAKQAIVGQATTRQILDVLGHGAESPPFPEEVTKWIEMMQISSQNLRKTS